MDVFDFNWILDFVRSSQGGGAVQSLILAMIWWQTRQLKRELMNVAKNLADIQINIDHRMFKIETRVDALEKIR